ncbi:MAG: hypothetical protein LWX07_09415 [Bacteroidetes bacterium]|nr:hypothetical protein [Bacteroidota bacterium]
MRIFFVMTAIIFAIVLSDKAEAQLKLHDNLAGPGFSVLADKSAVLFSGYYENEVTQVSSGLLGVGLTVKYSNLGSTTENNVFVGGMATYNFRNIGESGFVPFVSLTAGTDGGLKTAWYCTQAGVRYFVSGNMAVTGRFGLGNKWLISPEIGLDFRF